MYLDIPSVQPMAARPDELSISVVRHGDISIYIYRIYIYIYIYIYYIHIIHNIYKRTPCAADGCWFRQTLPLRSPTW